MSNAAASQLAKILEPVAPGEFLASTWGRSYRHVKGPAGKFARLLPWERLNDILRRHRLDFPRLRLMRDGKPVPLASYLRHVTPARHKRPIPRLLPVGFTRHLREGATLVLDAVDEFSAPLEELAEGLEQTFREHVQINCYAGWRTTRGFDLHWDDHDVFILQVAGRKRWRVYGETRPHPVVSDPEPVPRPDGEPLWEDVLADGDLLYIPRGWWHVAFPLDEPTLHLTVGIHNRTGLDLLRWFSERLRSSSELFRQDLPRLAGKDERAAHARRLREELLSAWDDEVLERYSAEYDATAEPRARVSLPWAAAPESRELSPQALVRLVAPRPLDFKVEDGVVEFASLRRRWRFAEPALAVLRPLAERRVCTVAELCEGAAGRLDERTVRLFVGELIVHGLAAIVEP